MAQIRAEQPVNDLFKTAWQEGRNLTEEQAARLEDELAQDPDDLGARMKLVMYYLVDVSKSDAAVRAQEDHIVWIIRRHPEAWVFSGLAERICGWEASPEVKAVWLEHLNNRPSDLTILRNASEFFQEQHDLVIAERLLKTAWNLEPGNPEWPKRLGELYELGLMPLRQSDPDAAGLALRAYHAALKQAVGAKRAQILERACQAALHAGELPTARTYATELLDLAVEMPPDRIFYGDMVHCGNCVLGHVALLEGDVHVAERLLLKAGKTPGSPVLISFGPDMSLAQALLDQGRADAVIEYLRLCKQFWRRHAGRLDEWVAAIQRGETPDFGSSLNR